MIPLLPFILCSTLIGVAGAIVVTYVITSNKIKEETKNYYPDAFKLLIKEKKKNAVDVGIFDKNDNLLGNEEIQSSKGVSKSIHKGQCIYI